MTCINVCVIRASLSVCLFSSWPTLLMLLMHDLHLHIPAFSCGVWNHSQWSVLMFTRPCNRKLPWAYAHVKPQEISFCLTQYLSSLYCVYFTHLLIPTFLLLCLWSMGKVLCKLLTEIDDRDWGFTQWRTMTLLWIRNHSTVEQHFSINSLKAKQIFLISWKNGKKKVG